MDGFVFEQGDWRSKCRELGLEAVRGSVELVEALSAHSIESLIGFALVGREQSSVLDADESVTSNQFSTLGELNQAEVGIECRKSKGQKTRIYHVTLNGASES